ncbi:MAG: methyltransferase domain-containing protein [Ignavibacteriaceae bacterium]
MKYTNHIEHYKLDAEYYNFFDYDEFAEQEHIRRYETIFNLHKIKNDEKILEIGSGAGHAVKHIKSSSFFPLDVSSFNLKQIKSKTDKKVFPSSGDVYNLPFQMDTFDFIILSEVLEHLDNPEAALTEILRVLKKNGAFIVSVPYKEKLSFQICIHCNKPTPTYAHLQTFDTEKLSGMMESVGFKVLKSHKFLNKIPNRLRLNIFFKKVPYKIWNFFDGIFNRIIDKPASIMILGSK